MSADPYDLLLNKYKATPPPAPQPTPDPYDEVLKPHVQSASSDPYDELLNKYKSVDAPSIVPTVPNRTRPVITNPFGAPRPYGGHTGVDLRYRPNTPVGSFSGGRVLKSANTGKGYGNRIEIEDENGVVHTYSHLAQLGVKQGETVTAGQQIGLSGNSGGDYAPHLHYERIEGGRKVNPTREVQGGIPNVVPMHRMSTPTVPPQPASPAGGAEQPALPPNRVRYAQPASPLDMPLRRNVNGPRQTVRGAINQARQTPQAQPTPALDYLPRSVRKAVSYVPLIGEAGPIRGLYDLAGHLAGDSPAAVEQTYNQHAEMANKIGSSIESFLYKYATPLGQLDKSVRGVNQQFGVREGQTRAQQESVRQEIEQRRRKLGETAKGLGQYGTALEQVSDMPFADLNHLASAIVSYVPGQTAADLTNYFKARQQVETGASQLPPLDEQGKQIQLSIPPAVLRGAGMTAYSLAKLLALKQATGVSWTTAMVGEAALQTVDRPPSEQATAIAHAFVFGRGLEAWHAAQVGGKFIVPALAGLSGAETIGHGGTAREALVSTLGTGAGLGGFGVASNFGGRPVEARPEQVETPIEAAEPVDARTQAIENFTQTLDQVGARLGTTQAEWDAQHNEAVKAAYDQARQAGLTHQELSDITYNHLKGEQSVTPPTQSTVVAQPPTSLLEISRNPPPAFRQASERASALAEERAALFDHNRERQSEAYERKNKEYLAANDEELRQLYIAFAEQGGDVSTLEGTERDFADRYRADIERASGRQMSQPPEPQTTNVTSEVTEERQHHSRLQPRRQRNTKKGGRGSFSGPPVEATDESPETQTPNVLPTSEVSVSPQTETPSGQAEVKEPWQQTKDEWRTAERVALQDRIKANKGRRRELSHVEQALVNARLDLIRDGDEHRVAVQRAISEGKPVPPEVLADYPDLQAISPQVEAAGGQAQVAPSVRQTRQSVKTEKVNNRTGLTPTQTEFLAHELVNVADQHIEQNTGTDEQGNKVTGEQFRGRFREEGGIPRSILGNEMPEPVTIRVPGDGEFTVRSAQAANRLHQKITGQPIEGFERAKNASVSRGTSQRAAKGAANTDLDVVIDAYGGEQQALDRLQGHLRELESNPDVAEELGGNRHRVEGLVDELKGRLANRQTLAEHEARLPQLEAELESLTSLKGRARSKQAIQAKTDEISDTRHAIRELKAVLPSEHISQPTEADLESLLEKGANKYRGLPVVQADKLVVGMKVEVLHPSQRGVAVIESVSPSRAKIMVRALDENGQPTGEPFKLDTKAYQSSSIGSGRSSRVEPQFRVLTDDIFDLHRQTTEARSQLNALKSERVLNEGRAALTKAGLSEGDEIETVLRNRPSIQAGRGRITNLRVNNDLGRHVALVDLVNERSGNAVPVNVSDLTEPNGTFIVRRTSSSGVGEQPRAQEGWGAKNRIVTADQHAEDVAELKKLLGKSVHDVSEVFGEGLPRVIRIGAFHLEAGARSFADWSARMIGDLGEDVRPYLKDIYTKSQEETNVLPSQSVEGQAIRRPTSGQPEVPRTDIRGGDYGRRAGEGAGGAGVAAELSSRGARVGNGEANAGAAAEVAGRSSKAPWQMTYRELRSALESRQPVQDESGRFQIPQHERDLMRSIWPEYTERDTPLYGNDYAVGIWEQSRGNAYARLPLEDLSQRHRAIVNEAKARGEQIPSEVLDDVASVASTAEPVRESGLTGTANAVTEAERAERGLDPVQKQAYTAIGEAYHEGRQAVESNEIDPRSLAQAVAQRPRPLSTKELGALGFDRARLKNEHQQTLDAISEAIDQGDVGKIADGRLRLERIEEDFDKNDQALQKGGREQSAAFNARKMLIKEDYSLAGMLQRAKVKAGRPLDPAERAVFEEISRKMEQKDKEIAAHQETIAKLEAEKSFKRMKAEANLSVRRAGRKATSQQLKQEFDDLLHQFGAKVGRASANPFVDPDLYSLVGKMARNRVRAGVNTVDGLVDEIHTALKTHIPDLDKRDLRDAISGYGKTAEMNQEAVAKQLRELKGQMRLISSLEDAEQGQRPLRSGLQRDAQSEEVRDLRRQVRDMMREHGVEIEANDADPEAQQKSALDALKTRLRNEISDLDRRVVRRTRSRVAPDTEAEALKAERDLLKRQVNDPNERNKEQLKKRIAEVEAKLKSGNVEKEESAFPSTIYDDAEAIQMRARLKDLNQQLSNARLTPEKKAEIARKGLEREIAELERRINEQDFSKRQNKTPLSTPELDQLRARRDDLRAEFNKLKPPRDPLPALKTRLQTQIDELTAQLAADVFPKRAKREPIPLDREGQRLKNERDSLKMNANRRMAELERQKRSLYQKSLEAWTNFRRANLLTAAKTHLRNITSNTTFAGADEISRPLAVVGDMMAQRTTGQRTTFGISIPSVWRAAIAAGITEGPDRVRDIMLGRDVPPLEGYDLATESIHSKMQLPPSDLGSTPGLTQNGRKAFDLYVNTVFRSMEAEDTVFKVYAFRRSMVDLAKSQALAEHAKDSNVNVRARTRELAQNPTDAMLVEAAAYADYATFQNKNVLSKGIASAKRALGSTGQFGIEQIAPFDRTPTNIIARTFEYSPAGFVSAARKYRVMAKSVAEKAFTPTEQREFARTFGRASTGTILAVLGMALAHKGLLSGASDYDTDKADYMEKRRKFGGGGMLLIPGTDQRVYIGDSPPGRAMVTAAAMYEQLTKKLTDKQKEKPFDSRVTGTGRAVLDRALDQPLAEGLNQLTSGRSLGEQGGQYVGSMLPASAMMKSLGEVIDEEPRQVYGAGFGAQVLDKIPLVRSNLPVNAGVNKEEWGPVWRRALRAIDPFNTTTEGRGPKKSRGGGGGVVTLTDAQTLKLRQDAAARQAARGK